ncbi:MAG: site-specific DNA-methyltransferase [Candidatus Methanofastidiosa archaeon]|nr:site-specific DNA-methyltransferase [Candidatus Methanofastidiosa archaeon]
MSFNSKLINLLKTNPNFVDAEDELLLTAIQDHAWKLDHDLIKLLLNDGEIKAKFFDEIDGYWIFNLNTFIEYISQKNFLDNSYTRFRNRIGLTIANKYLSERGEVSLVWPYKDCVLEGSQTKEEEKRKEIFFNEVLAQDEINRLLDPKVLTNFARYTAKGRELIKEFNRDENGVIRENLIIKGNNLITLHTIKSQFRGQVKMVYIDPPYNTEGENNTFIYNNNFNHSSWLTFMKNRLEVAKDLLTEDGVIVITIDDYEYAHLKLICDEVFNRENYVGTIVIQSNPRGRTINSYFATCHEYALFYAKDIYNVTINNIKLTKQQELDFDNKDDISEYRLLPFRRSGGTSTPEERPNSYYPIYYDEKHKVFSLEKIDGYLEIFPIDKLGKKRVWRQTRPSFLEAVKRGDMVCKKSNGKYVIYMKDRIKEGRKPKTIWTESKYDASANGTMILKDIFNGEKVFSYPKSLFSVKDTIDIITERGGNDIVLDFFSGSGTTAHAVIELNQEDNGRRQFILCEQMDYIEKVTKERVRKVMKKSSDEFIYFELLKYNEMFIERIQTVDNFDELQGILQDLAKYSFLNWYINPEMPEEAMNDFIAIGKEKQGLEKQKKLLVELLDKNQLYVNLSEIDDERFAVSEEDKRLNKAFYKES